MFFALDSIVRARWAVQYEAYAGDVSIVSPRAASSKITLSTAGPRLGLGKQHLG